MKTIIVILLFIFPSFPIICATIYAGPGASIETPCTISQPCKLSSAILGSTSGDTIFLLTGTYNDIGTIEIPHSMGLTSNEDVTIGGASVLDLSKMNQGTTITLEKMDITSTSSSFLIFASATTDISVISSDVKVNSVTYFMNIDGPMKVTLTRTELKNSCVEFNDLTQLVISQSIFEDDSGIYMKSTNDPIVTITDSVFRNNDISKITRDTVIHLKSSSSVTVQNCQFYGNEGFADGALFVSGSTDLLDIRNCEFSNNKASDDAGALYVRVVGQVILRDTQFMNNEAIEEGGAIFVHTIAMMNVSNCTFEKNRCGVDGGAGVFSYVSNLFVVDSIFSRNKALDDGGGVVLRAGQSLFQNVTFYGNRAEMDDGGGIFAFKGHSIELRESTLDSNVAGDGGGGIAIQKSSASKLIQVNLVNNIAGVNGGGASFLGSDIYLVRVLARNNSAILGSGGGIGGTLVTNTPILKQVDLIGNSAMNGYGGGLALSHDSVGDVEGWPVWEDGSSQSNVAKEGQGGGSAFMYLSGLTISNVNIIGNMGGGLVVDRVAYVDLEGCIISHNDGTTKGGGLLIADNTKLVIRSSSITNNRAKYSGGGMFSFSSDDITINNTNVTNNENIYSSDGSGGKSYGGGMYINNGSSIHIIGSTFHSNTIYGSGGGIFIGEYGSGVINNCEFDSNSAASHAGGLYLFNGEFSVTHTSFTYNSVGYFGGGTFAYQTTTTLNHTFFKSNVAWKGGGLSLYLSQNDLSVQNSVFLNNVADVDGGGIHNIYAGGSSHFSNLTFDGNRLVLDLTFGGGLCQTASSNHVNITNCRFTRNSAYFGSSLYADGGSIVISGSQFYDETARYENIVHVIELDRMDFVESKISRCSGSVMAYALNEVIIDGLDVTYSHSTKGILRFSKVFHTPTSLEVTKGVKITNSRFFHNTGVRGTIYAYEQNILKIEKCEFVNNSCTWGGAYYSEGNMQLKINTLFDTAWSLVETPGNIIESTIFINNSATFDGGSIYSKGIRNNMLIDNCNFKGGNVEGNGGDLFILSSMSSLIKSSAFRASQATKGGAVYGQYASVIIEGSLFEDSIGSCVYIDSGSFDLSSLEFSRCHGSGLQIMNIDSSDESIPNVIDSVVISHCQSSENGGGMVLKNIKDRSMRIQNTTFYKNAAISGYGGGLYIEQSVPFYLSNLHFTKNQARYGGGFVYFRCILKNEKLHQVVFTNNVGLVGGGAVFDVSGTTNILDYSSSFDYYGTSLNSSTSKYFTRTKRGEEEDMKKYQNLATHFGDLYSSKPRRFEWIYWDSKTRKRRNYRNGTITSLKNPDENVIDHDIGSPNLDLIRVYPGETFDVSISVLDGYDQVMNQFPNFFAAVKLLPSDSESRLKGFSFRVTFNEIHVQPLVVVSEQEENQDSEELILEEEKEEEMELEHVYDHLVFTDLSILRSSSEIESETIISEITNGTITSISTHFRLRIHSIQVDEELFLNVELLPCPSGTYRQVGDYIECVFCAEGKYSIIEDSELCRDCPDYGECSDPTKVISDENYWAYYDLNEGVVQIEFCDAGNCKGNNECDNNFDKDSPLCAACRDGYSEWSGSCMRCEGTNYFLLFLYIGILFFLGITTHLNSQEAESGIEKLYSFFGQTWRYSMRNVDISFLKPILDAIFGFKLPTSVTKLGFISDITDEVFRCPFKRDSYGVLAGAIFQPLTLASAVILCFMILILCRTGCMCCRVFKMSCFWLPFFRKQKKKKEKEKRRRRYLRRKKRKKLEQKREIELQKIEDKLVRKQYRSILTPKKYHQSNFSQDEEQSEFHYSSDQKNEKQTKVVISKSESDGMKYEYEDYKRDFLNANMNVSNEDDGEFDYNDFEDSDQDSISTPNKNLSSSSSSSSSSDKTSSKGPGSSSSEHFSDLNTEEIEELDDSSGLEDIEKEEKSMSRFQMYQKRKTEQTTRKLINQSNLERSSKKQTYDDDEKLGVYERAIRRLAVEQKEEEMNEEMFNNMLSEGEENLFMMCISRFCSLGCSRLILLWFWFRESFWENFIHFNRYLLTFLNFMIITYQLYSESSINYFNCLKLGDRYYLRSNTDVTCYDEKYFMFFPLFWGIGVYSIMFPLLLFVFLFVNRWVIKNNLYSPKFLRNFGTLYYTYHSGADWWYEPFSLLRRFILVVLMTYVGLIGTSLGNLIISVVLLLALIVHTRIQPFKHASENNLESLSLLALLLLQLIKTSQLFLEKGNLVLANSLMLTIFIPTFTILTYYRLRCILPLERIENLVVYSCCRKCCPCCYFACLLIKIRLFRNKTRDELRTEIHVLRQDLHDERGISNIDFKEIQERRKLDALKEYEFEKTFIQQKQQVNKLERFFDRKLLCSELSGLKDLKVDDDNYSYTSSEDDIKKKKDKTPIKSESSFSLGSMIKSLTSSTKKTRKKKKVEESGESDDEEEEFEVSTTSVTSPSNEEEGEEEEENDQKQEEESEESESEDEEEDYYANEGNLQNEFDESLKDLLMLNEALGDTSKSLIFDDSDDDSDSSDVKV